jgi:hypothetical protein
MRSVVRGRRGLLTDRRSVEVSSRRPVGDASSQGDVRHVGGGVGGARGEHAGGSGRPGAVASWRSLHRAVLPVVGTRLRSRRCDDRAWVLWRRGKRLFHLLAAVRGSACRSTASQHLHHQQQRQGWPGGDDPGHQVVRRRQNVRDDRRHHTDQEGHPRRHPPRPPGRCTRHGLGTRRRRHAGSLSSPIPVGTPVGSWVSPAFWTSSHPAVADQRPHPYSAGTHGTRSLLVGSGVTGDLGGRVDGVAGFGWRRGP